MIAREYANRGISACKDGDNPVPSYIIGKILQRLYRRSIDYRKLYTSN